MANYSSVFLEASCISVFTFILLINIDLITDVHAAKKSGFKNSSICEKNRIPQLAQECGLIKMLNNESKATLKHRLSDGIAAKLGQFPSFAFYQTSGRNCGATILGKDTLITAAHCMDENDLGSVRAGFVDELDASYEQQRAVRKICHHQNEDYDLAIIRTKKPFHFNDYVQAACISFKHQFNQSDEAVRYAVGMGATERYSSKSDKVLVLPMQLSCDRRNLPKKVALKCFKPESYRILGNICNGDTGGPIYELDATGRHFVSHIITELRNLPKGKLCAQTEYIDNLATDISQVEDLEHLFDICL